MTWIVMCLKHVSYYKDIRNPTKLDLSLIEKEAKEDEGALQLHHRIEALPRPSYVEKVRIMLNNYNNYQRFAQILQTKLNALKRSGILSEKAEKKHQANIDVILKYNKHTLNIYNKYIANAEQEYAQGLTKDSFIDNERRKNIYNKEHSEELNAIERKLNK